MCQECGCSIGKIEDTKKQIEKNPHLNNSKTIEVVTKILEKNDIQASYNRKHFDNKEVLCINIMSSPGSGKTSLLESLAKVAKIKFGVIEGDLETNNDASRLKKVGIEAFQITTGSACHLDAFMVHKALHKIDLHKIDVCFVENVGNLVCPAAYDVGAHLNIVLVSVPEGDDKVEKYPVMFRKADLVIVSKIDLLPYFNFDIKKLRKTVKEIKPNADIIEISIKDAQSIKKLESWIKLKKEFF
jgi:hydrogenase nickel incorporation protein HypB